MTLKTGMHPMMNSPQVCKLLSVLILFCGSQLHGQQVDFRAAAAAKAAAGYAARTHASPNSIPPPTAMGTFVTFDVPGAVTGTYPAAINSGGVITGGYTDGSGSHGFVRGADGTFFTFDVRGAVNGTLPSGINDNGDVTGYYLDTLNFGGAHGFVRFADGTFITFDVPGGANYFSTSFINPEGAVVGSYFDVNLLQHSFLRSANGTVISFDPPGAVKGSFASQITAHGVVLGIYFDANSNSHGFSVTRSGTFTTISGPGNLPGQRPPLISAGSALSMNQQGVVAGTYFQPVAGDPLGGIYRAFLLSKGGGYITFDGANYPPCCIFSSPTGINAAGVVTGALNDGFNVYRGFLRTPKGTVTVFDAPGAGTGYAQGTTPFGITPEGVVAGFYRSPDYRSHGFLFQPQPSGASDE